jgi:hypothetical protein
LLLLLLQLCSTALHPSHILLLLFAAAQWLGLYRCCCLLLLLLLGQLACRQLLCMHARHACSIRLPGEPLLQILRGRIPRQVQCCCAAAAGCVAQHFSEAFVT